MLVSYSCHNTVPQTEWLKTIETYSLPVFEGRGMKSRYLQGRAPSEEKAMAHHSSTLAWKIPWMEEPGGLQSMGSLRVVHD